MELHYLLYVLVIGCAGSITAFIKNGGGGGIRNLLKRTWDGCFSAYVVYEIAYFFAKDEHVSFAICGIGAWMGSEALIFVRDFVSNKAGNRRYDNYDDYGGNFRHEELGDDKQ